MILSHLITKKRTLNDSIAIMLRPYIRAIQKQQNMTDSLFQSRTKAICLTENETLSPAWFQSQYGTVIYIEDPEKGYTQVCFNYIHKNHVKSRFVYFAGDWKFSSYIEYTKPDNEILINRKKADKFGLSIYSSGDLKSPE